MPYTREQLEGMSDDQLRAIQQDALKRQATQQAQPRGILPQNMLGGFANALTIGAGGKPATAQTDSMAEKINTLIATEKLKQELGAQTPEGQLARKKAEFELGQGGGRFDTPAEPTQSGSYAQLVDSTQRGSQIAKPQQDEQVNIEDDQIRYIKKPSEKYPGYTYEQDPKQKTEWEAKQKGADVKTSKTAERGAALEAGKGIAFANFEKVSGSLSDLDRVFAEGHKTGQIGSIGAKFGIKKGRILGGKEQDKYKIGNTFAGKKAEVLFNMIPMLTQQGDKPGSVRIMESVLRLLGSTLPDEGTGLESGHGMEAESIRSFMRFARAAELSGLEFDKQFQGKDIATITDGDLANWVEKVNRASTRVRLSPEEDAAINNLIDNALKYSKDLIGERGAQSSGLSPEEQSELDAINKQLAQMGG